MNDYQNKVETNLRTLRRERFMIELNAKKLNKKVERASSLPKDVFPSEGIPVVEMPVEKKKVVQFAL